MLEILIRQVGIKTEDGIKVMFEVTRSDQQYHDACYFQSPIVAMKYVHAIRTTNPKSNIHLEGFKLATLEESLKLLRDEKPNLNYD